MTVPEEVVFVLIVTSGVFGALYADARRRQGGCRDYLCDAAVLAAVVERGDAPLPTPLLHGQPPPRMRSGTRPTSWPLTMDTLAASRMLTLADASAASQVCTGVLVLNHNYDVALVAPLGIGGCRQCRPSNR